jgi:alcohol dehydrogenase class IV
MFCESLVEQGQNFNLELIQLAIPTTSGTGSEVTPDDC